MATRDPFDGPGTASGIDFESLKGRLLLVTAHSVETVNTSFGEKDCVRADVVVLDGPGSPETYEDTLLFPKVLQGQVRANVGSGRMNLGRLGQGNAKPGQKPPWLLQDPTDTDRATARDWLANSAPMPF